MARGMAVASSSVGPGLLHSGCRERSLVEVSYPYDHYAIALKKRLPGCHTLGGESKSVLHHACSMGPV